jgi:hypothetical protein
MWEKYDDIPGKAINHGAFAAYDPSERKIWFYSRDRAEAGLFEFNPLASPGTQWRKRTRRMIIPSTLTAAIDPIRRQLVAIGGFPAQAQPGGVHAWDLSQSGNIEHVELQTKTFSSTNKYRHPYTAAYHWRLREVSIQSSEGCVYCGQ